MTVKKLLQFIFIVTMTSFTVPISNAKPPSAILIADDLVSRITELEPVFGTAQFKILKAVNFDAGVESYIYIEVVISGLTHEMENWSGPLIAKTHFKNENWSSADVYTLKRKLTEKEIQRASERSMKELLNEFGLPLHR